MVLSTCNKIQQLNRDPGKSSFSKLFLLISLVMAAFMLLTKQNASKNIMTSSTKVLRKNNLINGLTSVHRLYEFKGILDTSQYNGTMKIRP